MSTISSSSRILANRVDARRRALARLLGLSLALVFRLALLAFAAEIVRLTEPLATVFGHAFSVRDLLLLAGGLFLVWKATGEIHERVDPNAEEESKSAGSRLGLGSRPVPDRDHRHRLFARQHHHGGRHDQRVPDHGGRRRRRGRRDDGRLGAARRVRSPQSDRLMLALSFLLMIGMTLIADGFGFHIERGYVYAAMFFSSLVETLNTLARRKARKSHDSRLARSVRRGLFRRRRDARPGLAALVARVIAYGLPASRRSSPAMWSAT